MHDAATGSLERREQTYEISHERLFQAVALAALYYYHYYYTIIITIVMTTNTSTNIITLITTVITVYNFTVY